MKKWLKYSILISILMPLLMSTLSAQEYQLQKFVFGNGGMVGQQNSVGTQPPGPILNGLVGQAAIEKRDARSAIYGIEYDMYQGFWYNLVIPTSVNDYKNENNDKLKNYPNPFSNSTTVQFDLDASSYVTLKIYDMIGNEIITLFDGYQSAGSHVIPWNAKNSSGIDVGSGSYLYELSVQPASSAGASSVAPFNVRKVMVIVK